jgi:crossover junction endodeoxyribonuclease RuvC
MIIGIDPGFTGAIAFYDFYKGGLLDIRNMPLTKIKDRNQVNGKRLTEYIHTVMNCYTIKFAAVEDVHAMPEQGVTSTFRFGYSAGIIMGVLQALDIKVLRISPAAWKTSLNLSSDKTKSLELAKKVFPRHKDYFRLKKHDGRAEAALLAYYASQAL